MCLFDELNKIINVKLPEIFSYRKNIRKKEDDSYLTDADIFVQDLLVSYFSKHYRNAVFICEESDLSNFLFHPTKINIIIDPIDGTSNFKSGLKEWGIGISIYKGNNHQKSAIMIPELNQFLRTGMVPQKFKSNILALPSSINLSQLPKDEFKNEIRISGSCMYNMINTIQGSFYAFLNNLGAYSWDIMPGLNLALENKLKVTVNDQIYTGEFLPPNIKFKFKIEQI